MSTRTAGQEEFRDPDRFSRRREEPRKATGKVWVGCKIPNGIKLRLFKFEDSETMVWGGGIKVAPMAVIDENAPIITINGPKPNLIPRPGIAFPQRAGGFAVTKGVDEDFWNAWLEQNKNSAYVKNGLIWAEPDRDSFVGHAVEMKGIRSGMEPITPGIDDKGKNLDPRIPQASHRDPSRRHVSNVQDATDADFV